MQEICEIRSYRFEFGFTVGGWTMLKSRWTMWPTMGLFLGGPVTLLFSAGCHSPTIFYKETHITADLC